MVASQLAGNGLPAGDLNWITIPSSGGERLYAKFCMVIPAGELDDAWNIAVSRLFSDAGYGDLTWKITPVEPNDPDCENTTCSIPGDLFKIWLDADDKGGQTKAPVPPEPFGSEPFWTWFEDMDE